MARVKAVEPKKSLKELIPLYGENNEQAKKLKKSLDGWNKEIKEIMRTKKMDNTAVDGWTAKFEIRETETYDEEALLEYMHKHKEFTSCIKTKEYIDQDTLEELVYNGNISKKLLLGLDKFRVKKQTEYLTVSKAKEK